MPQDRIIRDLTGFRLPVGFTLPADAPESGAGGDASVEHVWKLELKVPGTAIHSVFEVPVFRTGKSPALMTNAAGPSMSDTVSSDLPALLAEQRIRAEFDDAGLPLSIIRPPARHRSLIVFLARLQPDLDGGGGLFGQAGRAAGVSNRLAVQCRP